MIGFIDRAAIPKMVIGFIVGVFVLVAGLCVIAFLPIHGNLGIVLFLAVFVVAFKVGEWAGETIWTRIQSRRF